MSSIYDKIREHGSLENYQEHLRETAFVSESPVWPIKPKTTKRGQYKKHKQGFKIAVEHKLNTRLKGRETLDGQRLYPVYVEVRAKRKRYYFPSCYLFYMLPEEFDQFKNTELIKTLFDDESDMITKCVIEHYNDLSNENNSNWHELYRSRFANSSTYHQQSRSIEQKLKLECVGKSYYKSPQIKPNSPYPVFKDSEENEVRDGSIIRIVNHVSCGHLNNTTAFVKWFSEVGQYQYIPDMETGYRSFDLVSSFVVIR